MTQQESRGRFARMRLFLCLIALLLVGGSVAGEIALNAQDRDLGKITKSGARPLRIAIVQMKSLDHDIDGNLRQATTPAERDQRLLSWPLGDRRFQRDCATVHGR